MQELKKDNKLHINFHNPNSDEETAKFLSKLISGAIVDKYLNDNMRDDGGYLKTQKS